MASHHPVDAVNGLLLIVSACWSDSNLSKSLSSKSVDPGCQKSPDTEETF